MQRVPFGWGENDHSCGMIEFCKLVIRTFGRFGTAPMFEFETIGTGGGRKGEQGVFGDFAWFGDGFDGGV